MPRGSAAALLWDHPNDAAFFWRPAKTPLHYSAFLGRTKSDGLQIGVCDGVLGDKSIHVTITPDNKRALILDGKNTDGFVQSEVRCKGKVPMLVGSCDESTIRQKWRCDELDLHKTLHGEAFPYVAAMIRKITPRCHSKPLELLMLGLGGGTMQSYIAHECSDAKLTTIEASSGVVEAARRFFGFTGKAKVANARDALHDLVQQQRHFDVIVVDITDTVLSKQDVDNLHLLLNKDGIVLQNHTNYLKMSEQLESFRKVFATVTEENFMGGNVVVTSTNAGAPEAEQALRQ
ncbi:speE [Symbiodinium natans]|uniref:SpeE protein n=1 Tax=Symbiodinium natans TaxID=878477 RepID=A0A812SIE3_9DINO|nr:speE [Symbiodinium natans]